MTKTQVTRLGKELRSYIKKNELPSQNLLEELQYYRVTYKEDLSSVFETVTKLAKETRKDSITAFRIKRIESILSKIRRQPTMALGNMGDIAGCRILLYDESSIPKLIEKLSNHFVIKKTNNYLKNSKEDGYRGYHIYIKSPINPNKLIEIQIRTIKSHKWASMVEIIDILYDLKIKEGEKHPDLEKFLFQLSRIDLLSSKEKQEIIDIDNKYKITPNLNEVFIKNNSKIRKDWFCHISTNNRYFIIEVDENKTSNISSFDSYKIAEETYFNKFKSKKSSNFVLTHIEKPNFKRVCIAYASYVLINHDYLNDWYKMAKEVLNNFINSKDFKNATKYKNLIDGNLKKQSELLDNEVDQISEYKNDKSYNPEGFTEWISEIKEKIKDMAQIVIEQTTDEKVKNSWISWIKRN